MIDDFETGVEHDTFDSNDPDRDRETAQGARKPDGKSAGTRKPDQEEPREAPQPRPRA